MHKVKLVVSILAISLSVTYGYSYGYTNGFRNSTTINEATHSTEIDKLSSIIETQKNLLDEKEKEASILKDERRIASVSRGGESRINHSVDCTVTAYSPYDDRNGLNSYKSGTLTSTGTVPKPGTIAVDPNVIPYNSYIIIVYEDGSMETGIAEDTGGAIKGNHIDVFRYKFNDAMKFGSRKATVLWYPAN